MRAFHGEADHVHWLLALTPKVLPSAFVNNRKTVTSRLLSKECADRLKRYYGASPYSGVAVTASSPGAAGGAEQSAFLPESAAVLRL